MVTMTSSFPAFLMNSEKLSFTLESGTLIMLLYASVEGINRIFGKYDSIDHVGIMAYFWPDYNCEGRDVVPLILIILK